MKEIFFAEVFLKFLSLFDGSIEKDRHGVLCRSLMQDYLTVVETEEFKNVSKKLIQGFKRSVSHNFFVKFDRLLASLAASPKKELI